MKLLSDLRLVLRLRMNGGSYTPPRRVHLMAKEMFTALRYFVIISTIFQFPFFRKSAFFNLNKSRAAEAVFNEFVLNKTRLKNLTH